jgi:hypothetical protein
MLSSFCSGAENAKQSLHDILERGRGRDGDDDIIAILEYPELRLRCNLCGNEAMIRLLRSCLLVFGNQGDYSRVLLKRSIQHPLQ